MLLDMWFSPVILINHNFSNFFPSLFFLLVTLLVLLWYFGNSDKCWAEKLRLVKDTFSDVHCTFGTPLFLMYYQEKFPRCLYGQAKSDNLVPIHPSPKTPLIYN